MMMELFLLCIVASFIQRTTGFGFGIFIMTMLPSLLPSYGEATTLSGLLALTTTLMITLRMYRKVVWSRLWPILLTFILVSSVAVCVLARTDDILLRRILGVTLLLISFYFFLLGSRIRFRPTRKLQLVAGTLSGLMGGFFGMQGPPAVLYFISSEPDKEHYLAMTSAYFLLGNISMTLMRAGNGFLTSQVAWGYVWGVGGVLVGAWLGAYVFNRLSGKRLRNIVYLYIGISGIITLLEA